MRFYPSFDIDGVLPWLTFYVRFFRPFVVREPTARHTTIPDGPEGPTTDNRLTELGSGYLVEDNGLAKHKPKYPTKHNDIRLPASIQLRQIV